MKDIKFGLKLWSKNENLISEAKKLIDGGFFQYVELMVLPGDDILKFKEARIPCILHIPHNDFGFNIGEEKTLDFSKEIIGQNIELANELSAEYLILHPGFGEMEIAKKYLKSFDDARILIENMPKFGSGKEKMIGFDSDQLKELMQDKFGLCLDFEHAIKASISMGTGWKAFVEELLKLKPKMFHVSDGTFADGPDQHLSLGQGEYDFKFFLDCVKNNDSHYVTLETGRADLSSLSEDLDNLKKIQKFL